MEMDVLELCCGINDQMLELKCRLPKGDIRQGQIDKLMVEYQEYFMLKGKDIGYAI